MNLLGGFLNPLLAAGAALAALPLLIHLLNRRRARPVSWGGMRFVIAAYKRTRRQAQFENLLLLLLRMAVVVLLALALARPFTGDRSPLSALTESRHDVVLVLDGSASTGYRESVETVFERIRTRAREILLELDSSRGDRVRLVLGRAYPQRLTWRTPEEALSVLPTLTEPTHEALDLGALLAEIRTYAEEDAAGTGSSALELRILTDLQRRTFDPERKSQEDTVLAVATGADAARGELDQHLDRLAELGLRIAIEDLGAGTLTPPNFGVVSLVTVGPVLGEGRPVEVAATLANHGSVDGVGVRVALSVDGERQPVRTLDVPARATAQVVFPVVFRAPGHHVLEARLEGDRLPADDVLAAVVWVPAPLEVLVVNGSPADEIDIDEVGFLMAALQPLDLGDEPAAGADPFQTREVRPSDLGTGLAGGSDAGDVDFSDFDVIVLANVTGLSAQVVESLEQAVAGGAALLVTLGDRVDPSAYNSRLWRPDGSGLLPAEVNRRIAVADRRESWYRVGSFDAEHPALAFFADERWRPLLTEVPVYEFYGTTPIDTARVLAALDDDKSSPLLLERAYDRGTVLLWTSSIDIAWNRLAQFPQALIPLTHELLRYAGRPTGPRQNVELGQPLVAEFDAFPRGPVLVRPDGSRLPLDGEPEVLTGDRWRLPAVTGTDQPGIWRIELGGTVSLPFAVRADPMEGDLLRMPSAELQNLHPVYRVVGGESGQVGLEDATRPVRGELWRWLAFACLAALVVESLWAARIGRHRRLTLS